MTQAFSDALALHRLARIKQRLAAMQRAAVCPCAVCKARRAGADPVRALFVQLGGEPEAPEMPPEALKAH